MDPVNKRKILFITPDYMDYTDIIQKGITDYLDADVQIITTTGDELKFKYKNSLQRLQNFFLKLLFATNKKTVFYTNAISQKLDQVFSDYSQFDDILIIRPDLIKEHLPAIKKHGNRMIAYFWDSFNRIPKGKETIRYFDKFYSFEPADVKEHKLSFLPNFHSPELSITKVEPTLFDLSYVASYDERVNILERILDSVRSLGLKTNINILTSKNNVSKNRSENNITWFTDVLPRKETIRIMNESKVILDIAQPGQEGLSFRIFEALMLEKKIITTNSAVSGYDFFDPNNIFVWKNETTVPSSDFFITPYSAVPAEIINKYSLENWVDLLFN